jgi:fibronectin-binding autotransporter adhesin
MRTVSFNQGFRSAVGRLIFFLATMSLEFSCNGTSLTWDPNGGTAPNPSDGGGIWLTASNWWNGSTNVNGTWTGATPDSAVFGAGISGSYMVALGSISASNVTFNTSGYTLSGGSLALIAPPSGNNLTVVNNVNATINSSIVQGGGTTWFTGSGATLTLGGGGFNAAGNFIWTGGGTNNIAAGIYTPAVLWLQNINVNQVGGTNAPGSTLFVGYGGNCNYTINGSSAAVTVASGQRVTIGRGGTTGTVSLTNGAISLSANGTLFMSQDSSSVSVLNVAGGVLNGASAVLDLNAGATSTGGSATVNISGGIATISTIQIGNSTSAYNAGTSGNLNVSGGTLYVGAGGIIGNTNAGGYMPSSSIITLSGGTVGAKAN